MQIAAPINAALKPLPAWPLYIVGMIPAVWYFQQAVTGQIGVEPVKALEHALGEFGLQLIVASLAITPLRRFAGINLLRFRRAIGVLAFVYIVLHLTTWAVLDVQRWSLIWADIVKRPYITIGMLGFALLVPLAVTSNNLSVRKLGANWRKLHKLAYPAAILGAVHFVMLVKGWQVEPLIYLAVILGLLGLRWRPSKTRSA